MNELLNEVFEDETTLVYTNLKPRSKFPSLFYIPSADVVVKLAASDELGKKPRVPRLTDKLIQVYIMSMSPKGNAVNLKNGLGDEPINTISTIYRIIDDTIKKYKIDSVLFRFQNSRMKGKGATIQKILGRLITVRSGGKYKVVDEFTNLGGKKYSYVMFYRKSKSLDDIVGVPEIDEERFTKVDSKVGEVYIDIDSGDKVSKTDAIAQTVSDKMENVLDAQVANDKVSRREVIASQYKKSNLERTEKEQEYYDELEANVPVYNSSEVDTKDIKLDHEYLLNHISDEKNDMYRISDDIGDTYKKVFDNILNMKSHKDIPKSFYENLSVIRTISDDNVTLRYDLIEKMFSMYEDSAKKYFANENNKNPKLDKYTDSIRYYTGTGYTAINEYLMGENNNTASIIKRSINDLDEAFKEGLSLDVNEVYRAMSLYKDGLKAAIHNKVFYFRNYVSTSLYPIFIKRGVYEFDSDPYASVDSLRDYGVTTTAMIIKGVKGINVINTAGLTSYPNEAEILLPRGLAVRINKVIINDNVILDTSVMNPEQLNEETELYDGDLFFNTGIIEAINTPVKQTLTEKFYEQTHQENLEFLASIIDDRYISDKFKQC